MRSPAAPLDTRRQMTIASAAEVALRAGTPKERNQIAWLARRVAYGALPDSTDVPAIVEALFDPTAFGLIDEDPWDDLPPYDLTEALADYVRTGIGRWMNHFVATNRPLEEWMTMFWHDHFGVSIAVVRPPHLMYDHIRTLRRHALGNFRDMLRDVTIDPSMLLFLNGNESTGKNPNENYGRELLELYALGIGNYTEADVKAAARALTGWRVVRRQSRSVLLPVDHDDTPQTFLGVDGVNDLDSVIDAVTSHPACAPFIARKLATAVLGAVDDATVADLAAVFLANDLEIAPLLRAIINRGLDGESVPVVSTPMDWFAFCRNSLGRPELAQGRSFGAALQAMGQIPLRPPNVGGFPEARTYLAASAIAGRFAGAALLAEIVDAGHPTVVAAAEGNWPRLARFLSRRDLFGDATTAALNGARRAEPRATRTGRGALAVALASPEMIRA